MAFIDALTKYLSRPREIYFLMISYLFTTAFNRSLSLTEIENGRTKQLLMDTNFFLENLTSLGHPLNSLFLLATAYLIVSGVIGRNNRLGKDILAIFLSMCWLVELLSINLLLIAPIKDPKLLLVEMLLFLPIIIVSFAWWYWRINYSYFQKNEAETEPITFKAPPSILNYLYLSIDTFFKYQPSYVSFNTKSAKSLHLFHAIVRLNILGLTLGRAVSLATSA
ncbi:MULTISPECIES: hypothetical protein [unclassified Synechococcus]|uniref:hypothetical protein n=1 Tax=unclassified Synechococcus TaxID=2626047 RepID=UPI00082DE83E|nr:MULTISPECIES: hypothetical protein [unclassified Synechococcus]